MTLYELEGQLLVLAEMAEDPDIDPQTLLDTMEAVEGEFEVKADGYAKVLKALDAQAKAIKTEEERLAGRRKAIETNAERIRDRLKSAMVKTGKKKFKTDLFSFSVRDTQGRLLIDHPEMVTDEYLIPQASKIDNKAIKQAIEEGTAFEWAHIEPGTSLTIR